jgi:hypothetical protein
MDELAEELIAAAHLGRRWLIERVERARRSAEKHAKAAQSLRKFGGGSAEVDRAWPRSIGGKLPTPW